jgi:hypothetical protein
MSVGVQFVYDTPQREIASLLCGAYQACASTALVAGFMTVEGIDAILQPIRSNPSKLATLVIGAGTYRAFDAFDQLLGLGVAPGRLRVHLGHSRPTGASAKRPFYRYHPMLHSKVYLFERADGDATAFVGSHNLTGFALSGLNGEAGVLLDGPAAAPPFHDIRQHINAAVTESVQYDPAQRDAYAWWAEQFMEGLADKFNDYPREGEAKKTIIILAQDGGQGLPNSGDVIYFELPAAIGKVQSLSAEIHLYVFSTLAASPYDALNGLGQARASIWCRTIGVEDDRGGRELEAAWHINGARPALNRAPRPFRPKPALDMQQVRGKAYRQVRGNFEYLFEPTRPVFEPVFDRGQELTAHGELGHRLEALGLVPPEHLPWFKVTGFTRREESGDDRRRSALRKLTPAEGAFILLSMRRLSRSEEP